MDRLLTRLLLGALLSCAMTTCSAGDSFYSIAGDVKTPQTYKVSDGSTVRSGQLLSFAQAEVEQGALYVLRDNGKTLAAVVAYDTNLPTAEIELEDGDQVIVVAGSSVSHQCGNAVVLLNTVPDVLKLDQKTLPVADLLSRLQLPNSTFLEVTRIENGSIVTRQLDSSFSILHGDIIHLGDSIRRAGLTLPESSLAYVTLPWESEEREPSQVLTVSSPEESLLTIPAATSTPPAPASEANGQMELLPAEPIDLATVVPEDTAAQESAGNIRSASLSSQVSEPASTASEPGAASSNAIWNTVFVGGLLVAMALIAVGWMKTQNEINSATADADENQISEASPASREVQSTPLNLPPLNDTNELGVAVDDDCPILSAGLEETATADEAQLLEELDAQEPSIPETPATAAIQTDNVVLTESWFDDETTAEVSSESEQYDIDDTEIEKTEIEYRPDVAVLAEDGSAASQSTEIESEIVAEAEALPDNQLSDNDLEDLIQNRIPVELTTAQLPLRVNLFGEPAGPKRLRIDAAHTEIAPPHMLKKAPAGRGKKPETAAVKSPQKAAPISTGEGLGHLDRALNYLEEQTDE